MKVSVGDQQPNIIKKSRRKGLGIRGSFNSGIAASVLPNRVLDFVPSIVRPQDSAIKTRYDVDNESAHGKFTTSSGCTKFIIDNYGGVSLVRERCVC